MSQSQLAAQHVTQQQQQSRLYNNRPPHASMTSWQNAQQWDGKDPNATCEALKWGLVEIPPGNGT